MRIEDRRCQAACRRRAGVIGKNAKGRWNLAKLPASAAASVVHQAVLSRCMLSSLHAHVSTCALPVKKT
ncbi:hypothetical protein E2C01_057663 [Portunus trituberculatus]|uniref:Uncharacterized protein n=1 Tax=Portunus trituberculatus TaxID=210409 RepID=A0A5B7H406_PORTR|nr:hypothetical protein [Portunus trituberculatus]